MHCPRSTIAKKIGCSVDSPVEPAAGAAGEQEQVLATSRTCAAAMDAAGRGVMLWRAGTPAERQTSRLKSGALKSTEAH